MTPQVAEQDRRKRPSDMRLTSFAIALCVLCATPALAGSYSEDYWKSADILTKRFICSSYGAVPDWCDELPGRVEVPKSIAGNLASRQKNAEESAAAAEAAAQIVAAREAIVKRIRAGRAGKSDVEKLVQQAKAGETEAMELMAWMYAQGLSPKDDGDPELNEMMAYIWYGRAYLAGAKQVKENMDKIWPALNETQQNKVIAIFDRSG